MLKKFHSADYHGILQSKLEKYENKITALPPHSPHGLYTM
jgi:hypothetical protein